MNEQLAQQQLNMERAQETKQQEMQNQDRARQAAGGQKTETGKVPIPWLMLCVAGLFDLIGMIPIVNIFSEIIAGLIFGWWQKQYVPKTDPLITFIVAKIIDFITVGFLPSNIAIVVYAYIKKKAAAKLATPIGKMVAKKIQNKYAT